MQPQIRNGHVPGNAEVTPERKERAPKKFTPISIAALKPEAKQYEVRDLGADGLYVAVSPTGFKGFVVRYRCGGKPRKLTLGRVTLKAARKAAGDALNEAAEGRDPAAAKQKRVEERHAVEADTFKAVVEKYLTLVCGMKRDGDAVTFTGKNKLRTAARRHADLERLVLPTLGKKPITEIRRSQITALLDEIQINNGEVAADRTLALIRKIMNWHATRADHFETPIVRAMARTKPKERQRKRTLTDQELKAVWKTAGEGDGAFRALVRFLLLTGARRSEASEMTWTEITGTEWTLPASRNKVKIDLTRPLSAAALAVIKSQRNDGSYVFSTTEGKAPVSAFSKFKANFDKASGTSGWTLHDLRRSAKSLMSRAGVTPAHSEQCLGHVIKGVEGNYDQHDYRPEMKIAYDKLATLIELIANPPEGNVTPLRKKRA